LCDIESTSKNEKVPYSRARLEKEVRRLPAGNGGTHGRGPGISLNDLKTPGGSWPASPKNKTTKQKETNKKKPKKKKDQKTKKRKEPTGEGRIVTTKNGKVVLRTGYVYLERGALRRRQGTYEKGIRRGEVNQ